MGCLRSHCCVCWIDYFTLTLSIHDEGKIVTFFIKEEMKFQFLLLNAACGTRLFWSLVVIIFTLTPCTLMTFIFKGPTRTQLFWNFTDTLKWPIWLNLLKLSTWTTQLRWFCCDHYSTRHVSVHKRTIIRGMLSVPMYITTMVISMTWNSIWCVAACCHTPYGTDHVQTVW